MTGYPATLRVLYEDYIDGETDALGNPAPAWRDPTPVPVIAYGPPTSAPGAEPNPPGRPAATEADLVLYSLPGFHPHPRGRFTVDGRRFEVVAPDGDWTCGFHGWQPGGEIKLKRVEG